MDGYADFEIFWRITLPIGLPAIFTTVTLNFIILWNEYLYAVVLLTDDEKRTLPLGIMHFMGGHQLDVGMIATGLMIAIAPVILLYALFSETMTPEFGHRLLEAAVVNGGAVASDRSGGPPRPHLSVDGLPWSVLERTYRRIHDICRSARA